MPANQFDHDLQVTADELTTLLPIQMPNSPYRDFFLWAFSDANTDYPLWLQTIGLSQLVQLTIKLYEDIAGPPHRDFLIEFSIPINIYQVYEIVSDNLAIGLANPNANDPTHALRHDLLLQFNRAMVKRLSGAPQPATQLLAKARPLAEGISLYDQSLSHEKHRAFAHAYLRSNRGVSLEDVEFSVWTVLVANIESCLDVAEVVSNLQVGGFIRQGLIKRYQAVSTLLQDPPMSLDERINVSTDAILVAPILAYFIGGLAEVAYPVKNFHRVFDNDTLPEALRLSALLIRLLNDLGTGLIMQSPDERAEFIATLRQRVPYAPTFAHLLNDAVFDNNTLLTRIDKDLRHGEYNLGFFDLLDTPYVDDAVTLFDQRLTYYSQLYALSRKRLQDMLIAMNQTLKNNLTSTIIERCVVFHERLYAKSFRESGGEYAV